MVEFTLVVPSFFSSQFSSEEYQVLSSVWNFIRDLYTYPFELWKGERICYPYGGGCIREEPDHVSAVILGFLILLGTLVVLFLLALMVGWLYDYFQWLSKRQECQHEECDHQYTTDVSDGSEPGCLSGRACCADCAERHRQAAIQRAADAEPKLLCVHGHGEMAKIVEDDVTRDECLTCGGVWLEGSELREIKDKYTDKGYDSGYSAGRSSGNSSGLATGIAIGIAAG
jgi:hypothetical protein